MPDSRPKPGKCSFSLPWNSEGIRQGSPKPRPTQISNSPRSPGDSLSPEIRTGLLRNRSLSSLFLGNRSKLAEGDEDDKDSVSPESPRRHHSNSVSSSSSSQISLFQGLRNRAMSLENFKGLIPKSPMDFPTISWPIAPDVERTDFLRRPSAGRSPSLVPPVPKIPSWHLKGGSARSSSEYSQSSDYNKRSSLNISTANPHAEFDVREPLELNPTVVTANRTEQQLSVSGLKAASCAGQKNSELNALVEKLYALDSFIFEDDVQTSKEVGYGIGHYARVWEEFDEWLSSEIQSSTSAPCSRYGSPEPTCCESKLERRSI